MSHIKSRRRTKGTISHSQLNCVITVCEDDWNYSDFFFFLWSTSSTLTKLSIAYFELNKNWFEFLKLLYLYKLSSNSSLMPWIWFFFLFLFQAYYSISKTCNLLNFLLHTLLSKRIDKYFVICLCVVFLKCAMRKYVLSRPFHSKSLLKTIQHKDYVFRSPFIYQSSISLSLNCSAFFFFFFFLTTNSCEIV